LLTYLKTYEPHNVRESSADEHCLVEHDSLKMSNGKWFWHSRGFGGHTAYQFLTKVRGMEFREAIQTLLDGRITYVPAATQIKQSLPKPKEPLVLPPPNKNNDAVYAYLRGRGIDRDIIRRCFENGSLYEAAKTKHCVFVGFDDTSSRSPKYACMRGTIGSLKQDAKNSDKRFGFVLPPKNPASRNLVLLESPVDALSLASIYKMGGHEWDGYRLSLGGVSSRSLMGFLERHTGIENIHISLDNDRAGKDATKRIIQELLSDKRFSHIKLTIAPPPLDSKDFSDALQSITKSNIQNIDRSKQAGFLL